MSDIPSDLYYTEEHEYLKATDEDGVYAVGITDYAQGELGDVVFVELPEPGASFDKGDPFGVIESVKAVSDLYAPISGEIVAVNQDLADRPELVNEDCYGDGWMVALVPGEASDLESLMDAAAYKKHIAERQQD
jgi:glycine cleavage system H protein